MIIACLWIIWCLIHSLLISTPAHRFVQRFLGKKADAYRVIYVLISSITLLPVLYYQLTQPEYILVKSNPFILLFKGLLFIYGLVMLYLGARVYDMQYFLGYTQWKHMGTNARTTALPFHTDGVLRWVRHPWYSGGIALIWGFGTITDVYLATRLILTAYFILGTIHEEKRLVANLGKQYTDYQKKVPMLIPWKFGK